MIPLSSDIVYSSTSRLLEYGLLGVFLVLLGVFAWHLYRKIDENSNEWKDMAKSMNKNYTDIVLQQNEQNKKLIAIQRESSIQNKQFHDSMKNKMDRMPTHIVREIRLHGSNLTSAPNTNK